MTGYLWLAGLLAVVLSGYLWWIPALVRWEERTADRDSRAAPPPERVRRKCGQCATWLFGATEVEALDRLATHARTTHLGDPP